VIFLNFGARIIVIHFKFGTQIGLVSASPNVTNYPQKECGQSHLIHFWSPYNISETGEARHFKLIFKFIVMIVSMCMIE